jgi:hypothetical protein
MQSPLPRADEAAVARVEPGYVVQDVLHTNLIE